MTTANTTAQALAQMHTSTLEAMYADLVSGRTLTKVEVGLLCAAYTELRNRKGNRKAGK